MRIKLPGRFKKVIAFTVICILGSINVYSQLGFGSDAGVDFTRRQLTNGQESVTLRGDLTIAANNILNRRDAVNFPNTPYDGNESNNGFVRDYINIDPDGGNNFSSSTASINIPDCSRVKWAGLYWSGSYISEIYNNTGPNAIPDLPEVDLTRTDDFQNIRFKVPGSGYTEITADDVIYNADSGITDRPYACFKDVTTLLQGLTGETGANGDYTVANVKGTRGISDGGSAGWVLVVIYEDPTLSPKHITVFDGFKWISVGQDPVTFDIAGFTTIPTGPVRARMAVSALEGDRALTGDTFSIAPYADINNFTLLGSTPTLNQGNPTNNFFDSTITNDHINILAPDRNIDSENTMGFDADIFDLSNPSNSVIGNGETGVRFRMSTEGDSYGAFLATFAVDVIEPDLQLVKTVEDGFGNDIGGTDVALGQQLEYVISFQNTGTDDATNTSIKDVLPANVSFQELSANLSLPPNVTYVYNAADHEITFTIPDNLVVEGQPSPQEIRFSVNVVNSCFELRDACSNEISNQAFATYSGVNNPGAVISDDPSYYSFDSCNFGLEGPSNYISDIGDCIIERDEILCANNISISAGDGYNTYQWYTDLVFTGVGGRIDTAASTELPGQTNQILTVTEPGIYGVVKTTEVPCLSIDEIINVIPFTSSLTHPVVPLINNGEIMGTIETCSDNGEEFPQIFLCGINDNAFIDTDMEDGVSLIWEQLDTNNCNDPGTEGDSCPNTGDTCFWNQVKTGNDYTADTPGEFRLRVMYQNGCMRIFYFNVYANVLDPVITPTDIICTTLGSITVDTPSPAAGFEFQLVDNTTGTPIGVYQSSNTFTGLAAGEYYVNARQITIADGCVFRTEVVQIRAMVPTIAVNVVQPTSSNDLGSAIVQLSDGFPQYTFELLNADDNSVVQITPAQDDNFYEFTELAEGNYTVFVRTSDGCEESTNFSIIAQSNIELTASVSQNISCGDGAIQVHSSGGQTPHGYAIYSYNGVPVTPPYAWQTSNVFDIPVGEAGTYTFIVVDDNSSMAISNEVTIIEVPPMNFGLVYTDTTCYEANDGSITITMYDQGGYIPLYSIDGGMTFQASPYFTGLVPGNYDVVVRGTIGRAACDFYETVSILSPAPLSANVELTSELSCSEDGMITFSNPTGGSGNYEYSIGGAFQASPVFTGLTEGVYTPQIRDANNLSCVFYLPNIVVNEPENLSVSLVTDPITCLENGTLYIDAYGGFGGYTYLLSGPSGAQTGPQSSGVFEDLLSGVYEVTVIDANGCSITEIFDLQNPPPVTVLSVETNDPTCNGSYDGEVSINVEGVSSSYFLQLFSEEGLVHTDTNVSSDQVTITGLKAGIYDAFIIDNTTHCETHEIFVLNEPEALTATAYVLQSVSCSDGAVVEINASGGVSPYQYSIDGGNFSNSPIFNNLQEGTYTPMVIDSNGCYVFLNNLVVAPANAPYGLEISSTPLTCENETSNITATVLGGNGPFIFELLESNGIGLANNNGSFSGLTAGNYVLIATDSNGCSYQEDFNIFHYQPINLSFNITPMNCDNNNTGAVSINVGNGNDIYQYSITKPDGSSLTTASPQFNDLDQAGTYSVLVTDNYGCNSSQDFILEESKCTEEEFEISVITHPNPASDRIQITVEDHFKLYSVELISLKGEVTKYKLTGNDIDTFMDIYDISRGIYILRLTSSDGKVTYKRIVKQ